VKRRAASSGLEHFLVFRVVLAFFIVFGLGGRRSSSCGLRELRVDGSGDLVRRVRVDEADDDVDQAALAGLDLLVLAQHELERHRVARQRRADGVETFLDALGDADFALARQQLDRTHLAHVHAHRVGGAAELRVDSGERSGGFLGSFFVGDDRFREQQRLGLRGLLVNGNAHVVNHVDDIFDLLRIDDFAGQVIVDLDVSQKPLLLAARDQQLQLRLTLIGNLCRFLLCCQSLAQV
jgi:hypothetical protein